MRVVQHNVVQESQVDIAVESSVPKAGVGGSWELRRSRNAGEVGGTTEGFEAVDVDATERARGMTLFGQ